MGGSKAPQPQAPSAEERALQTAQTAALTEQNQLIKEQYEQTKLLAPYLYKQAGLVPQYDQAGKITGFTESDDPAYKLTKEVNQSLLERTRDAIAGKLPVDSNVTTGLAQEEKTLRETMAARFGPDWETSTPGIEALGNLAKTRQQVLDSARRGDISTYEALSIGRSGANAATQMGYLGAPQQNAATLAQLFGNNIQGYSQALQPYMQNRQMSLNASIAGAQSAGQAQAGMFSAGGAVVGTAAGVAIAM
jgi:hypothetical protein